MLYFRSCFKRCSRLCNLKTFKSWDFSWKMMFFVEKILESFQEHFALHFLSRKRVRFSNCLGSLKTIKFFGFLEKKILFLRSKCSSKIRKRGIFLLACVSSSINAQGISKRSKIWEFRENRWVFSKNRRNFFKITFLAKILENVSQKEFFL